MLLEEAEIKSIEIKTAGLKLEAKPKAINHHADRIADMEADLPTGHGELRDGKAALAGRPLRPSSPNRGHDLSKILYAIPESTQFRHVVVGILRRPTMFSHHMKWAEFSRRS